jgi:hypothetical protein
MKPAALVLIAMMAATAADPPLIRCPRASQDFALSADPAAPFWKAVNAVDASVDPQGAASPARFQVKMQWTPSNLYLLFICPYDELYLKPDPKTSEETYQLWNWDVTELFMGADLDNIHRYREYQVSPQGEWVDLDIDRKAMNADKAWHWNSGFEVQAKIDSAKKIWYGAMKIPMASLDSKPAGAGRKYRLNLYRLSGKGSSRQSTMWTPTMNRSHHTPERFGFLVLEP